MKVQNQKQFGIDNRTFGRNKTTERRVRDVTLLRCLGGHLRLERPVDDVRTEAVAYSW